MAKIEQAASGDKDVDVKDDTFTTNKPRSSDALEFRVVRSLVNELVSAASQLAINEDNDEKLRHMLALLDQYDKKLNHYLSTTQSSMRAFLDIEGHPIFTESDSTNLVEEISKIWPDIVGFDCTSAMLTARCLRHRNITLPISVSRGFLVLAKRTLHSAYPNGINESIHSLKDEDLTRDEVMSIDELAAKMAENANLIAEMQIKDMPTDQKPSDNDLLRKYMKDVSSGLRIVADGLKQHTEDTDNAFGDYPGTTDSYEDSVHKLCRAVDVDEVLYYHHQAIKNVAGRWNAGPLHYAERLKKLADDLELLEKVASQENGD